MQLDHKAIGFSIKASEAAADVVRFSGLGSVFGNIDGGGDIVEAGAFADSLKARQPKMLLQHGFGASTGFMPVGKWLKSRETDDGLELDGELWVEHETRLAARGLKSGELDGLSIGYNVKVAEFDNETGIRRIKQAELWEVSIVTWPMNELARVERVKNLLSRDEIPSKRDLEKFLRDAGLSRKRAEALLARGYEGLSQGDPGDVDLIASINHIRGIFHECRTQDGHRSTRS